MLDKIFRGFWHALIHEYHDIIIAVIQLLLIGPLIAFFLDILRRRKMRVSRRILISNVNYMVFGLLARGSQALRVLDTFSHYEGLLKINLITKKVLEEDLNSEHPSEGIISKIHDHNLVSESYDLGTQSRLEEAVYRFRTVIRISQQVQAALVPNSAIFDPDESEDLIAISRAIAEIGSIAEDSAFFVQARARGLNAGFPPTIIYGAAVVNWTSFINRFADSPPRSLEMRISQWVSRKLFGGNPYQDFSRDEIAALTKHYEQLLGDSIIADERQAEILKIIGTQDLRYFILTRVEVPARTA